MAIKYSDTTNNYRKRLTDLENNQPAEYQSKYQSQIDSTLNKILNREAFSYDFNADPLYQQYKDQYTKLGKEAAMNAAATVSDLTGGYGNSYAATAASQANQQYLSQLNNVIPELYNAAMSKYQMDTSDLNNKYGLLSDAENAAYGRYRDTLSDYYTNRDYYNSAYNNALSNDQWNANFAESQRQFNLNYALQKAAADRQKKADEAKKTQDDDPKATLYKEIYDWMESKEKDIDYINSHGGKISSGNKMAQMRSYLLSQIRNGLSEEDAKKIFYAYTYKDWDEVVGKE